MCEVCLSFPQSQAIPNVTEDYKGLRIIYDGKVSSGLPEFEIIAKTLTGQERKHRVLAGSLEAVKSFIDSWLMKKPA